MKMCRLVILATLAGVAVCVLELAMVRVAAADSAADAKALPGDEFRRLIAERTVDLDKEETELLVKLIAEMEKPTPDIDAVGKKLRDGTKTLTYQEIVPMLTDGPSQAICTSS